VRGSPKDQAENRSMGMREASTSVSFSAFMTAVVFFFIGLLLTGEPELQLRLRIALLYFFGSAFGFMYSALVYANATGAIARLKTKAFERNMVTGNALSEYFGVYGLALAVPVAVLGYSPDQILSLGVFSLSSLFMVVYHAMGYSILERYIGRKGACWALVPLIGLSGGGFFAMLRGNLVLHYGFYASLAAMIFALTCVALCGREKATS